MRRLFLFAILFFSLTSLAQDARQELQFGVECYKAADYEAAIQHFQRATQLDPSLLNARLYLATTYAQQYVPGAETPANTEFATRAIAEYKKVIESDPKNINAMNGIAYLDLMVKRFDDARAYYDKAAEADPSDPENYYSAGVIDWTESYQLRMAQRAALNLSPGDTSKFINMPQCWDMRNKNLERVERGIKLFAKALQLRPDYDDAMAYMNLMYRERADIQCGDRTAADKDLNAADNWVDLTMATKKRKAEKQKPKP